MKESANGVYFDIRTLPVEGLLDCTTATDPESFVHKKYVSGRPNKSLDSTARGTQLALDRILSNHDDDAHFGVHIKETAREFRALFGKR